eukprot:TRINITY_DN18377_c0_g1_i1.p1 TRINITY_DN18377_c0_g1~~TRINITY_DN18377_c0_g1_i1.p1  ORF type:complete len:403 (-),score=88.27 TRINITY_DN18377_c0_g1_i1:64-1149(-)
MALIFSNNPEQVFKGDCCDNTAGGVALLEEMVAPGKYRNFWEYLNQNDCKLGWAIVISNEGTSKQIGVQVHGSGNCTTWTCGGRAVADMFNNYNDNPPTVYVAPGKDYYVMRMDAAVANSQVISGNLDMTITGGNATVRHIAYCDFAYCTVRSPGEPYITRDDPMDENEGTTYKGMSPYTVARAENLAFTIPAGSYSGRTFNVTYRRYNMTSQSLGSYEENDHFVTNIGPSYGHDAVFADMIPIDVPGWGWMRAEQCCDSRGDYPNFGNWAVDYQLAGTVTNLDSVEHTLTMKFRYPGCDSAAAFQKSPDSDWEWVWMTEGSEAVYMKVTVPARKTSNFQGRYMLAGPACGAEHHTIQLVA